MDTTLLMEDDEISVHCVAVSEMDNRCYLLTDRATGRRVLIDAADDAPALLAAADGKLDAVLTTHSHWDHTRALAQVVEATGAETAAGAEDVEAITEQRGVRIDRALAQGDVLFEGSALELTCVHLRGHTPGSIAYLLRRPAGHLAFTGDSLFPGGVGNTDHDPGRFTSLLDDVEQRLFAEYDDSTVVYPGHGEPTTLGAERPHLGAWRTRGW